jgi:hypothetical protein
MLRILLLIFVLTSSNVLAQTKDLPKAYLFDEFGTVSTKQIKIKTQKLREKIQEQAWSDKPLGAYVVFYYGKTRNSSRNLEIIIQNSLFDNCRDCMGFSPRITFIRSRETKEEKVQFWLIPAGAEPPKLD